MSPADRLRTWFSDLLMEWRRAWDQAEASLRERVRGSLCVLSSPTQCWCYVRSDAQSSIVAALLLLRRDPDAPDGEMKCMFIDGHGEPGGDAPRIDWVLEHLEGFWANMRVNWTPGRPVDPPPGPWHIGKQRIDQGVPMTMWMVPWDPAEVSISAIVDHAFQKETEPSSPAQPRHKSEPHIFEMGMDRERVAIGRWLHHGGGQLMQALGVPGGWWLGMFLPRQHVFGDGSDGDVDILAGPVEFALDEDQWRARVEVEAERSPLGVARSNVVGFAALRAASEGMIRWPPRLDLVAACEAKASWFRPDTGTWKATHQGEARRVKGQLHYLMAQGVDRVSFLHLGATEPREQVGANPWIQAAGEAAAAEDAFPEVYAAADLPSCGYFTAVLGAVPFAAEHFSGAGGLLRVKQACQPKLTSPATRWRDALRERLARLPQPRTPTAFIAACPCCGEWSWQGDPSAPTCTCSAS